MWALIRNNAVVQNRPLQEDDAGQRPYLGSFANTGVDMPRDQKVQPIPV